MLTNLLHRIFPIGLRLCLLAWAVLTGATVVQAAANVSVTATVFTPADSARTYMDVGGVWNGTTRIDPGNGDVFSVTYTNGGDAIAYDVAPQVVLPSGFTRVGAATVTASSGTPALSGTPATTGTVVFDLGGFDLAIGATLTITYRLKTETTVGTGTQQFTHGWTWAATNGGTQNALTTSLQNVTVRAGAYVIAVSPGTMTRAVNQSGTFTYTISNTGFGGLFNLSLDETSSDPGSAWDFTSFGAITAPRATTTSGAIVTIPYLGPGESFTILVNGTVTNCIDINNTFTTNHLAATSSTNWTNPVTLDLQLPLVDYTVGNIALNYSSVTSVTIPFSNTGLGATRGVDVGGGTRRMLFSTNFPSLGVTITNVAANWTYNATTGVFSYSGNSGSLPAGQTINLTFDIRSANYCAPSSGSILYGMQYEDSCGHPYSIPAKFATLNAPTAVPSVGLTKTGSGDRLVVGYGGTWTLTLSAQNTALITGTNVVVTDNLPAGLTGIVLTSSAGTATRSGNTVTWTVPKSSLGSNQTLTIGFNAPSNACDGGLTITNTASVNTLTTTAGCSLTATASHSILLTNNPNAVLVQNFDITDPADGTYETGTASADATRDNGEGEFIPAQVDYTIGAGYPGNWAGSTYKDNFGGVTQMALVPGTLEVSINGGGSYTAVPGGSVSVGAGGLTVDLGFLAGASYFNTATISDPTINRDLRFRYKCTAPDAALGAGTTRTVTQLSVLTLANGGGSGACNTGTFTQGDLYTLARAAGGLGLSMPSSIVTCDTFPLVITVSNATAEHISNVLVTLNTQVASGDYGYVIGQTPTYGGVFNSGNITVTENAGNFPTFRYTGGDLTASGTITINVLRRSASTTNSAVTAALAYDDNETNPSTGTREFTANASASPSLVRQANLQILTTPQNVVIYGSTVTWTIYVTNGGTGTAFTTELVDTFPTNVTPDIAATVAANSGIGMVTGDVAVSGADVTLQLHSLASGETKKVVLVGDVAGSGCTFTSVANAIKVRWGCSGGYIQNQQQTNPTFTQPSPQIDVSHEVINSFANLCDTGTIEVVVRNVGNTELDNISIKEVINTSTSGLTFVSGSVRYSINNGAFNSPSASYNPGSGTGNTGDPYVWTSAQIPELASLVSANNVGNNMVRLRFDVSVSEQANASGTPVSTTVDYQNPCGNAYTKAGSVFTVTLKRPNITIVKTGINRTVAGGAARTGSFGGTVLAGQGDAVEWRVQITNNGNYVAKNVRLKDDFSGTGGTAILTNSTGGTPAPLGAYTSGAWVTLPDIPASTTVTYYFNETVGSTCNNALNTATVTWGCVDNGSTAASNLSSPTTNVATARLNTVPSVAATAANTYTYGTVDNGRLRQVITLTNAAGNGHATQLAFTLTLPASIDLDTSWTALSTAITAATKFTTSDSANPNKHTGYTITGSHPTYTITFNGPGGANLRAGTNVTATLYYLPRDYPDTTANPATPTMAQIASFASPETTANSLDPTVLASANITITPTYASTCGGTITGTAYNSSADVRTPDLDITVSPTIEQISASTAPYTFVFNYAITNNGESNSVANRIRFRLSSVGSDWASVSVALVTPGTGGSTITTTNAGNNYLIDESNFGYLGIGASALVTVTVTTIGPSGGPPATSPTAANLTLVGEVEGSIYNQGATTSAADDVDTGVNYSLDRAAPLIFDKFTVAGYLYFDANHNAQRDAAETTRPSGTYYAKIIPASTPAGPAYAASAALTSTGYYEFTGAIPPDDYIIIIDNNNTLADVTPTTVSAITNTVGTEMPTLQRPVHVGSTSIIDQNFGRYNGSRYSGVVFADTGAGGGTANNGIQDGGETGIAGATIKATNNAGSTTVDTALSAADGTYTLWVPSTVGTPFKIVETNVTNYRSTGATVPTVPAGGTYTIGTDTISFPFASGSTITGFNFGDVPPSTFTADGTHAIVAGASTVYPHVFTAGTAGKVSFNTTATATPATYTWTHLLYLDPNCNGVLDPGETTVVLPATEYTVVAGQQICLLLKQNSPAGGSYGISNQVVIPATFTALNGVTVVPTAGMIINNTDITTIGTQIAGGLELTKEQVLDANCDAAETSGFTISPITTGAVPGACVKYRLTYKNNGNDALYSIDIYDTTPAFTTFVSATADTPPANLGATVTITAPAPGGTGAIHWIFTGTLAPGSTGTVYFTVRVKQ